MRDGTSTAGTPGTGLGAIERLASVFDIYSAPGAGIALLARVWPTPPPPEEDVAIGGLSVPRPGEQVSGDCWTISTVPGCTRVFVADGLGHGPGAAEASEAAAAVFRDHAGGSLTQLLERMHDALRPLFVSFHCNKRDLLTDDAIAYLKRYGPVGCRDWTTVYLLLSAGVPAFFSGCPNNKRW